MTPAMNAFQPPIRSTPIPAFSGPQGQTCVVALSWHLDGEAGVLGSDPAASSHVAALSEGAYGISTALPRILQLHRDLGIPGTFFVPGYVADLHPEAVEAIGAEGHEVAHHGYLHQNCYHLDLEAQRQEFLKGIASLRRITGQDPLGWSAPGWGVRPETLGLLSELGFLYDASLMEYDTPYWLATPRGSLVELPISMVLDDWEIFGGGPHPGGGVNATAASAYEIWREEFEGLYQFRGFFATTFHPNLMGRPGRLKMLYRLLEYMQGFEGVWWATCGDIAAWVQEQYVDLDPCQNLRSRQPLMT